MPSSAPASPAPAAAEGGRPFQLDVPQVVDVVFRAPAEVQPKLPKDFALKFEIHGGLIREEVAERENKSAGRRGKGRRRSAACAVS